MIRTAWLRAWCRSMVGLFGNENIYYHIVVYYSEIFINRRLFAKSMTSMRSRLYIDRMTDDDITDVEMRMRTGEGSPDGLLGKDEDLHRIITADATSVIRAGTTHREIADALDSIIKGTLDGYRVSIIRSHQAFDDPFAPRDAALPPYANLIITARDEQGESLRYRGVMSHLIRNYQFFGGHKVDWRVSPSDAARFLRLGNYVRD